MFLTTKKHQAYEAVPAGVARVRLKTWVQPALLAQAAATTVRGWTSLGCTTHLGPSPSVSLSFELLAAAGAAHEPIAERALAALQAAASTFIRVVVWVESGYLITEHEHRTA